MHAILTTDVPDRASVRASVRVAPLGRLAR